MKKKKIIVICLVVLIICAILIGGFCYIENEKVRRSIPVGIEDGVEARNSEYEVFFGDYISAANTKAFLIKIMNSNKEYDQNKKKSKEGRKFVSFENKSPVATTDDVKEILAQIKPRHYKIDVINQEQSKKDNADVAGYYKNGLLKTFSIVVVPEKDKEQEE